MVRIAGNTTHALSSKFAVTEGPLAGCQAPCRPKLLLQKTIPDALHNFPHVHTQQTEYHFLGKFTRYPKYSKPKINCLKSRFPCWELSETIPNLSLYRLKRFARTFLLWRQSSMLFLLCNVLESHQRLRNQMLSTHRRRSRLLGLQRTGHVARCDIIRKPSNTTELSNV